MPSCIQARSGRLALGLLLALSVSCQVSPSEEVLYACEPEGRCPLEEQICSVQNLCLPRDQAIRILSPVNDAHVQGTTRVDVALDVAGVDPATLVLTITRGGLLPATATLRRQQVGRYTAQWTPSRGPGPYELRASAPGTGLESAPVSVVLDSAPPGLGEGALPPEGSASEE